MTDWLSRDAHEDMNKTIVVMVSSTKTMENDSEHSEEEEERVSHSTALSAFDTCIAWYKQQKEMSGSGLQDLLSMRDLSAKNE